MNIKQIEIFRSPIKLKSPFIISLGEILFAENIFIRITTSGGLKGYGECSPFASINGETIDTCFVVGRELAKNLAGKDPLDTDGCSDLMDKTIYGNSSIKSAFSIAIFDIASQYSGLPLYEYLGGINNKKIVTDYTISIGDPQKMAEDAIKILERGFGIIKVKVGRSGNEDIERIKHIRKAIGMKIPIRIDANQGWEKMEAIHTLKTVGDLNIQFCEEPIAKWDYMSLPELRSNSPVPIMGDESCFDHHDAKRLINLSACDYLNIKLGKSAGFTKAMKIVELAEKNLMKMQIGGFLESRLGFTASAHLALTSNYIEFFDFDSPLMMEEDPIKGGITYNPGGIISMPDAPGLGATIDEGYLKSLKCIII